MAYNISKLAKIANILDQNGKYVLSDKFDHLIKIAQNLMPTTPEGYNPTGPITTGNPLIDSLYANMSDSAAGNQFAGGKMYDFKSPYRSMMGPNAPGVLPTLTPAQFAELSKTEQGRNYIAQMQLRGGLQGAMYQNLSNVGLVSFGKFIEQNLGPGVSKERKQVFVNDVLPGTLTTQISNIITRLPIDQWTSKLQEFSQVASGYPEYAININLSVNKAVKSALDNLRYHDPDQYGKIIKDPKFKPFKVKYNLNI